MRKPVNWTASFLEIPMNSDTQKNNVDLMDFACRFFKSRGAALESGMDFTDILVPPDLARSLEVEELITVVSEKAGSKKSDTKNRYPMQFQSPLLERITSLAGAKPSFLQAELKFEYIKTQGFDRLITEAFDRNRTKIRITGTGVARTRYLILTSLYQAQSDELKEGLMDFCFNLDTGALIPDMIEPLIHVQKEYPTERVLICSPKEIENIYDQINQNGKKAIEEKLSHFVESMNRRFKRDAGSLEEYYHDLTREMEAGLSRTGLSERLILEREEKIALIPAELNTKKQDLLNKYSIRIDFQPVAALAIITPCVKVFAELMSGRQKAAISLIYNPVTKHMDPVVCRSCGTSSYSLTCCDCMHLNCRACLMKGCTLCGGKK